MQIQKLVNLITSQCEKFSISRATLAQVTRSLTANMGTALATERRIAVVCGRCDTEKCQEDSKNTEFTHFLYNGANFQVIKISDNHSVSLL
jgi:hypothetical protein